MLQTFDATTRRLVRAERIPTTGWVHVVDPDADELDSLQRDLAVPAAFLAHALDVDEIARVDRVGTERLVVMRVPSTGGFVPYRAFTLGVLLETDRIITIARHPTDVVDALLQRTDVDPRHHDRFVLLLLMCAAERFLARLAEIERVIAGVEARVEASVRNEEVSELLRHQKELVHFSTALAGNQIMLARLRKDTSFATDPDCVDLLEDVEVELRQASDMTTVASNILSGMMDAFASIISNNLNVVMKAMTALMLLMAIPGVMASIYGMNVSLPLQRHPFAFLVVIGVSFVLALGAIVAFRRRRWL